jgi:hypothetical protein
MRDSVILASTKDVTDLWHRPFVTFSRNKHVSYIHLLWLQDDVNVLCTMYASFTTQKKEPCFQDGVNDV